MTRFFAYGSSHRRRWGALALLGLIVPAGLVWRLMPLHLPPFAFKYGGSALWAMAVYWLLAALLPWWRELNLFLLAGAVATAVELLKIWYWAPLDHSRETLAGKLLLGRHFTLGALVTYWLSLVLMCWIDSALFKKAAEVP